MRVGALYPAVHCALLGSWLGVSVSQQAPQSSDSSLAISSDRTRGTTRRSCHLSEETDLRAGTNGCLLRKGLTDACQTKHNSTPLLYSITNFDVWIMSITKVNGLFSAQHQPTKRTSHLDRNRTHRFQVLLCFWLCTDLYRSDWNRPLKSRLNYRLWTPSGQIKSVHTPLEELM